MITYVTTQTTADKLYYRIFLKDRDAPSNLQSNLPSSPSLTRQ